MNNSSILDSTAFKKSNVQIFVHYPNQLLQSIKNPTFSSSFSEYQFNKLLELKISQGTLLRKRPDSNDRCYENIQDHDMHLQMKMSIICEIKNCIFYSGFQLQFLSYLPNNIFCLLHRRS